MGIVELDEMVGRAEPGPVRLRRHRCAEWRIGSSSDRECGAWKKWYVYPYRIMAARIVRSPVPPARNMQAPLADEEEAECGALAGQPLLELDNDEDLVGEAAVGAATHRKRLLPMALRVGTPCEVQIVSRCREDNVKAHTEAAVMIGLDHDVVPGTGPHSVIPQRGTLDLEGAGRRRGSGSSWRHRCRRGRRRGCSGGSRGRRFWCCRRGVRGRRCLDGERGRSDAAAE